MAEDKLMPTDFRLTQDGPDGDLSFGNIVGYTVNIDDHGYGENGGRANLQIAVPAGIEFYDESGDISPDVLAFHDALKCALAEKGIHVAGSDLFGGAGSVLEENGRTTENVNYNDRVGADGSLLSVGNTMGQPDMQEFARDGENWVEADVTRLFILDTDETANMSNEEFAEIIRQAYHEAVLGVDDSNLPPLEYRGNGNAMDVDNLSPKEDLAVCTPSIPVA